MSEEGERDRRRVDEDAEVVRFVVTKSGISEAEARELIKMLGYDRASLLREALLLKKSRE